MSRNVNFRVLTACIAVLMMTAVIGCSPVFWIKKYRDMPDVGVLENGEVNQRVTIKEKNFNVEKYYQKHYGKRKSSKYFAEPIKIDETKFVTWHDADIAVTPLAKTYPPGVKLTFFHLSDVQLRDEQVRLYDKETSKLADYIIPSFEHGPLQEVFDGAAYYAIIQTINATVKHYPADNPLKPKFMIHTGDAIDAGVVNELYEFLYISNEIGIPWYNAIGNHDVGTFGNIKPKMIYVNDPFVEFMTMHSKFNFINLHHSTYEHYPFVNVSPANTDIEPTVTQNPPFSSKYNGFDKLNYTTDQIGSDDIICDDCPGYYSIEVKESDESTKDPAIRMIVLDTGFTFGAYGSVSQQQLDWLEAEIDKSKSKIVLIFGHHNLKSISNGNVLKELFAANPSVIGYFCGHTHQHQINYYSGKGNAFGFWEVITGATFAYPMQGSLVRVKYEAGFGILEIYAFEHTVQENYIDKNGMQQISELYKHAQMAYAGAVADISPQKKAKIDYNLKDRYARLKFPYHKAN